MTTIKQFVDRYTAMYGGSRSRALDELEHGMQQLQQQRRKSRPSDGDIQDMLSLIARHREEFNRLTEDAEKKMQRLASMGGTARARSLSPIRKKAIARKAAKARWSK